MWTVIHIRANEGILRHIYLLICTEITYLPAAADALVDGALGPSSLCPTRWHQPTGYMSGLSQSSHWSYSSSQPSKCIFRRRPTTRDTVPTHTNRGSMRSAASNLMPTTKPWAGISCRQMIKCQAAPRYKQGCWTNKWTKLNKEIPISINGSEVKLGSRNEWQSGHHSLGSMIKLYGKLKNWKSVMEKYTTLEVLIALVNQFKSFGMGWHVNCWRVMDILEEHTSHNWLFETP